MRFVVVVDNVFGASPVHIGEEVYDHGAVFTGKTEKSEKQEDGTVSYAVAT